MQKLVRSIVQAVLFEKRIPSLDELKKIPVQIPDKVLPTFVTLYDHDVVIGSAGRLYPVKESFLEELIDNTEQALNDSRFVEYKNNPEKARNLWYRVDTFENNSRRMLHHPDDIDTKSEGMILICRKQKKVGVILPHMVPETLSWEDIYHMLVKKVSLNLKDVGKWDLILYGLKTHIFKDENQ